MILDNERKKKGVGGAEFLAIQMASMGWTRRKDHLDVCLTFFFSFVNKMNCNPGYFETYN